MGPNVAGPLPVLQIQFLKMKEIFLGTLIQDSLLTV